MKNQLQTLKINNISKSFFTADGEKKALKSICMELKENSFTVIGGENGSGKSVLMSIIAGLEEADSGNIETFGQAGLVFQEAETQILGETPFEDVCFGPKNLGWKKEQVIEAANKALEITGLTEKKDFPARFLSGGEKRRLAVACMIAMDLPILILDEPYANLDYSGVKQVNQLLTQLKDAGKTIILLTHEIEKCLGLADNFVVLFRGKKVFDGKPEEGLQQNLEQWNIKHPITNYNSIKDLIW